MSSKLREALSKASIALSWATHGHLTEDDAKECLAVVDAALAEPLRNCDVGSAEEQSERFRALCRTRCDGCACFEASRNGMCEFVWAQMPYESSEQTKTTFFVKMRNGVRYVRQDEK